MSPGINCKVWFFSRTPTSETSHTQWFSNLQLLGFKVKARRQLRHLAEVAAIRNRELCIRCSKEDNYSTLDIRWSSQVPKDCTDISLGGNLVLWGCVLATPLSRLDILFPSTKEPSGNQRWITALADLQFLILEICFPSWKRVFSYRTRGWTNLFVMYHDTSLCTWKTVNCKSWLWSFFKISKSCQQPPKKISSIIRDT